MMRLQRSNQGTIRVVHLTEGQQSVALHDGIRGPPGVEQEPRLEPCSAHAAAAGGVPSEGPQYRPSPHVRACAGEYPGDCWIGHMFYYSSPKEPAL